MTLGSKGKTGQLAAGSAILFALSGLLRLGRLYAVSDFNYTEGTALYWIHIRVGNRYIGIGYPTSDSLEPTIANVEGTYN
jgi:hypothetical protein